MPTLAPSSTTAPMDVMTAIATRRSIGAMRPDVPPRAAIAAMLEAATYAPNHHRTEPWFFHVLTGERRIALARAAADAQAARGEPEAVVAKTRRSFGRAPVVIAVTSAAGRHAIETRENEHAVAAAIQNMLLAGTAQGLATIWRTGALVDDPTVRTALGLAPDETILGYVYVGYPAAVPAPAARQHHTARSRWWE